LSRKEVHLKLGLRRTCLVDIRASRRKLSIVHQESRKDNLTAFQELAGFHQFQAQVYERVNSFEKLFIEQREPSGYPAFTEMARKLFPQDLFHYTQLPSIHRPMSTMIQRVLATTQAGGRPWHCPCESGFADMQNARVRRLHSDFKGRPERPTNV
jgi:hypothetical protein